MLAKAFLSLTRFPFFRKLVWKPIYNQMATRFPYEDWHFMNYGYHPLDQAPTPKLHAADEMHRYPLQLYHFTATEVPIKGKKVLEVGCGRGGGASYIARYLEPSQMTGLDIADKAIDFCKKTHLADNLDFIAGNAQQLPFSDNTFDVVINVESCHAYPDEAEFLAEVKRVLKPGGHLLCTDVRINDKMEILRQNVLNCGLKLLAEKDIAPNVVRAIELEDDAKWERINRQIGTRFRAAFAEFAGVKGSEIHRSLKEERRSYCTFILQKV